MGGEMRQRGIERQPIGRLGRQLCLKPLDPRIAAILRARREILDHGDLDVLIFGGEGGKV